jgi:hypothetical protein
MQYILLIYTQEEYAEKMTAEQFESLTMTHRSLRGEAGRLGILGYAEPLMPTSTSTTVRMKNGKAVVTDGPFAETKEQLAGFYLLDCENLDDAIQWASRIPAAYDEGDGCVEIRPLRPRRM